MAHSLPRLALAAFCLLVWGPWTAAVEACPFCSAASQTLSEELQAADAALLAEMVTPPDEKTGKALFRVTEVLKGEERLKGKDQIEVVFFGEKKPGTTYLVTGIGQPKMDFTTPLPLSDTAVGYLRKLFDLPKQGPDRLAFFQDYLQHEDPMLAQDAYDEFARAPYQDLIGLKDRIAHDRLIEWIQDPDVPPSRRRLYLTMLGVCRDPKDLPMLEAMIRSEDRRTKLGLDAMIASYLRIKGPAGLALIEDLYLKNHDAPYQDTYAAVTALRFHGQEGGMIPRARILQSLRYLLDHPDLADQIIPDLARWQDWSVLDRMGQLFKKSDEQSRWVRIPVVNYLRAASKAGGEVGTRAAALLEELAKIDPESIQRANSFFAFGALSGAAGRSTPKAASTGAGGAKGAATANAAAKPAQKAGPASPPSATDDQAPQAASPQAASPQAASPPQPAAQPTASPAVATAGSPQPPPPGTDRQAPAKTRSESEPPVAAEAGTVGSSRPEPAKAGTGESAAAKRVTAEPVPSSPTPQPPPAAHRQGAQDQQSEPPASAPSPAQQPTAPPTGQNAPPKGRPAAGPGSEPTTAQPPGGRLAETKAVVPPPAQPPSRFRLIAVTVLLGAILLATLWWILRRPEGQTA